jgi:gas vesicle protein
MIVILGLVILVAAVIVGVGGVLGNGGSGHALSHGFALFGYHVTGSTGTLFLYGIVVGAVALFGLSLLLAGARRTSLRSRAARRGLKQSRNETAQSRNETAAVSRDRDDMIAQRDTARAETASARQDDATRDDTQVDSVDSPVAGSEVGPVAGSEDSPVAGSEDSPVAGSEDSPVAGSEDSPVVASAPGSADGHQSRWQLFGHRSAHQQAVDTGSSAPVGQPTAAVPADEPVAANKSGN